MVLPPETLNCFDIPPVKAGWIALRPLTLADVAVLARAGIDILSPLAPGDAQVVFALLAGPFRASIASPAFMRLRSTARQRMEAVARALDIAFRNAVPGHSEGETVVFMPRGYGWPLEIAERLMHEYGMSFDEAASMPLVRVYSLLAVARIRGGGKAGGPDYFDRANIAQLKGGSR